ncbi:MAG: RNA polymerase sigma factor [Pricia sp.]
MNVEQLIQKCIKKDRRAQETLYNTYKKKLFPVCLKYCRSHSEAEDHLHDVFIEIFDQISKYKGKGSFEGWMKRIAINTAIDKYKKNKTFGLEPEKVANLREDTTLEESDLPPTWEELIALIQELPDRYRIVFSLYELDDFSHKDIASALKISENTSKSNLHRAKAILKDKISGDKKKRANIKSDSHGT